MANLREKTVGEVEADIAAILSRLSVSPLPPELELLRDFLLPPRGMSATVSLRRRKEHLSAGQREDIRSDAKATSKWDPSTCKLEICFEPGHAPISWEASRSDVRSDNHVGNELIQLIKALDGAERDPRYREFVGLKPFRDFYLAERGFAWSADNEARRAVVANAIDRRLVMTYSVPNPKHPNFPTTAIRLDRENPEVRQVLKAATAERSAFKPVAIRGEALSSTVLSDRR